MITAERLRELMRYDPETGVFTRRVARGPRASGSVAGCDDGNGYLQVMVDGTLYRVHRLTWLYMHGVWPLYQVDHINGIRDDNRLNNLRLATSGENGQNRRKANCNSRSGVRGVSWDTRAQKWRATLMLDGKLVCSSHVTLESAIEARHEAVAMYHPFAP